MPNWTISRLVVEFDRIENVMDFHDLVKRAKNSKNKEADSLLMHFIPRPLEIYVGEITPENKDIIGKNNSIDWNIDNWNTKWPETILNCIIMGNKVIIDMETAWTPPLPLVAHLNGEFGMEAILMYNEYNHQVLGVMNSENEIEEVNLVETALDYGAPTFTVETKYSDFEFEICKARNEYLRQKIGYDMSYLPLGG